MWQDSDISGGKVRLKFSTTPSEAIGASGMAPGEVAINVADGKFFYRDEVGAVQSVPGGFSGSFVITDANAVIHTLIFTNGVLTGYDAV